MCKLLKAYGSEHDHVDDYKQTPLYYAIKSNRVQVFEWLLDQGCDLKIVDKRG